MSACLAALLLWLRLLTGCCILAVHVGDDSSSSSLRHVSENQTMLDRLPWYHTTDMLHQEYLKLSSSCVKASFELSNVSSPDGKVVLDMVQIRRPGVNGTTATMFFGVHGREFFSAESGLYFMKTLCGQGKNAERADKLLDSVGFVIMPNANPLGRKLAEDGDFCKRTNENNVDLNRNWGFGEHVPPKGGKAENNPGPNGFSEPETSLLRGIVDRYPTDLFVDIHSGSYLLGTPWCYEPTQVPQNQTMMNEILKPIAEKYCQNQCPYGNAADLVGYAATGCDMDYVKAVKNVPFVFTWEIFIGEKFRTHYINLAEARRKNPSLIPTSVAEVLDDEEVRDDEAAARKCDRGGNSTEQDEREGCLRQFNPMSKDETTERLENWSAAYLDLCERVHAIRRQQATQAADISLLAAANR